MCADASCRSCAELRELKPSLRDQLDWTRRSRGFLHVDLVLFVHEFEKLVIQTYRFGRAKNQQSSRVQRVVKLWDAALVQFRAEINEHVAATNYVEPRERRIGRDVLARERADIPYVAMNLVGAVAFDEKTLQPRGRHVLLDRARGNSEACMLAD